MKVLLVSARPNIPMIDEMEPIGLCYLSAYLKAHGHHARVVHQTRRAPVTDAAIVDLVRREGYGLVGFTTYNTNISSALNLARQIKAESKARTVLGGPMATVLPELARQGGVDFVSVGEGEEPLHALVEALEHGHDLHDVPSLCWAQGDEIIATERSPRLQDLDALPFPDRDGLPWDRYHCSGYQNLWHEKRVLSVITSRGCPFNCRYCATKKIWRSKWIPRSVDNVMAEINTLIGDPKKSVIGFMDQDVNVNRERSMELFETIGRDPRPLEYFTVTSVLHLDDEMIQTLDRTGCSAVFFGVESGSSEVLKTVNRQADMERNVSVVKALAKTNIFTVSGYMVGFPDDDRESIRATRRLIRRLPADMSFVSLVNPYPGTELFDVAVREGWITREGYLDPPEHIPQPHMPTHHLTRSQVRREFWLCVIASFTSPTFLLHVFKTAFTRPRRTWMMVLGILGDVRLFASVWRYNRDKRLARGRDGR